MGDITLFSKVSIPSLPSILFETLYKNSAELLYKSEFFKIEVGILLIYNFE